MTNRNSLVFAAGAAVVALPILMLGGCGGSSSNQAQGTQQLQPPPPAPPPAPRLTSIEDLMQQLNIDERISMLENEAPRTDAERRAVLEFVDSFVRADASAVRDFISAEDREQLEGLVAGGRWHTSDDIDNVLVVTGPNTYRSGYGSTPATLAVLAIFENVDGTLQPTLWYYDNGTFTHSVTPLDVAARMSGSNMIDGWHRVIQQEVARASEQDVELRLPQQILQQRAVGGGRPQEPEQPTPPSIPGPGGPGGPGPGGPGGPGAPGVPL